MPGTNLPSLDLDRWRPTRDALQAYAQVLGKVRAALTPRRRHWSHITLHVSAEGLTTTPIPAAGGTLELRLDLADGCVWIVPNRGRRRSLALDGSPPSSLCRRLLAELGELGVGRELDGSVICPGAGAAAAETGSGGWDGSAAERFHQALSGIEPVFQEFKGQRRRETTPVQLFPHHFDLALSWFSGRLAVGQDPADEDSADEQMTFGFSTGDDSFADPYFYVTAYPEPHGFVGAPLPGGARWEEEAFRGALFPYSELRASTDPCGRLLGFFERVHRAGAERMAG